MTPSEAALVLTFAAAFDRRTVGEADAEAWSLALSEVDPDEARQAITKHYRFGRDFIMPSDVLEGVKSLHNHRRKEAGPGTPPTELPDELWGGWNRAYWAAVESGLPRPTAELRADDEVGVSRDEPLALEQRDIEARVESIRKSFSRPKPLPANMPREVRRIPSRWAADRGLQIVDPHNWDGNFRTQITEAEFDERIDGVMTKPFTPVTAPIEES